MSEEKFWFEEVPEEHRYWFLAPSGTPPQEVEREAEREAELQEMGLSSQDAADLRNIERDARSASVFGTTEDDVREIRRKVAEMRKRSKAVGYGADALDVPWWTDVLKWVHEEGDERVSAPILYTQRERAESELRSLEEDEPAGYLRLVEEYGHADVDDALDNTVPYRALWVDRNMLLDKLEDSLFLHVMVDGVLRLRRDFIEQLRSDETEEQ